MTLIHRLTDALACGVVRTLCAIDGEQIDKVPSHGPLILIANHVNFLEAPILYCRLRPRPVTALAKAEAWDNPLLGWLFDQWGTIPIRRGESDIGALRQSLRVLKNGEILAVAPEGTRSRHGRLQRGRTGIVTLAVQSGAPLLPVVCYGGEAIGRNIRRLRRTPFRILVGEPFHVDTQGERLTRELRQQITDEIMYRMAALLPPAYRGVYANLEDATAAHLQFGSLSSLDNGSFTGKQDS